MHLLWLLMFSLGVGICLRREYLHRRQERRNVAELERAVAELERAHEHMRRFADGMAQGVAYLLEGLPKKKKKGLRHFEGAFIGAGYPVTGDRISRRLAKFPSDPAPWFKEKPLISYWLAYFSAADRQAHVLEWAQWYFGADELVELVGESAPYDYTIRTSGQIFFADFRDGEPVFTAAQQ